MPKLALRILGIALAFACVGRVCEADDAAIGYAKLRPSLVKVWSFDAQGRPVASGTGLVIVSNAARSLVLSAAHVVAGATTIAIDIDRDHHDIAAHVVERGPRDLVVLAIDRGRLATAMFAPRVRQAVEGNIIAVAGFVEHDELIGVVGQEPRLLYPGTISSRPDDGAYLELENVHVEEGLSGGPVFEPDSGDVLGIVTSRTADQRGGFADSGALVVVPFLAANAIAFHARETTAVAARPKPVAIVAVLATPKPIASPKPIVATLRLADVSIAPMPLATLAPRALPTFAPPPVPDVLAWDARNAAPLQIAYDHAGCAIVLSLAIERLSFGETAAEAHLRLRVARRVAPIAACSDIAESDSAEGSYEAAASTFNGRHLRVRFRFVDDADPNAPASALFPSDVSLDADLDASPVTAHVQLVDHDWGDAVDVIASRDR